MLFRCLQFCYALNSMGADSGALETLEVVAIALAAALLTAALFAGAFLAAFAPFVSGLFLAAPTLAFAASDNRHCGAHWKTCPACNKVSPVDASYCAHGGKRMREKSSWSVSLMITTDRFSSQFSSPSLRRYFRMRVGIER